MRATSYHAERLQTVHQVTVSVVVAVVRHGTLDSDESFAVHGTVLHEVCQQTQALYTHRHTSRAVIRARLIDRVVVLRPTRHKIGQ